MPMITGKNGKMHKLDRICTGGHDIGKVYLGEDLVFEKDSATWLTRGYATLATSKNGATFNLQQQTSVDTSWLPPVYCGKRFILANTNIHNLIFYSPKYIRNNSLISYTKSLPTDNDTLISISSDSDNVLVISSSRTNAFTYSLDAGDTWNTLTYLLDGYFSNYIGEHEFFLYLRGKYSIDTNLREKLRNGYYLYWKSSSPNGISARQYKLPNEDTLPYQQNGMTVDSVQVCNNGRVYTRIFYENAGELDTTISGMYYGTKTQATGKVVVYDFRGLTNSGDDALTDITYINNKYYAISGNPTKRTSDDGPNNSWYRTSLYSSLYTSDDGITFYEQRNYFPDLVEQIAKNNGVLQVYGKGFFGYIDKNNSLHCTRYTDANDYWTSKKYIGGMACNKFHKM